VLVTRSHQPSGPRLFWEVREESHVCTLYVYPVGLHIDSTVCTKSTVSSCQKQNSSTTWGTLCLCWIQPKPSNPEKVRTSVIRCVDDQYKCERWPMSLSFRKKRAPHFESVTIASFSPWLLWTGLTGEGNKTEFYQEIAFSWPIISDPGWQRKFVLFLNVLFWVIDDWVVYLVQAIIFNMATHCPRGQQAAQFKHGSSLCRFTNERLHSFKMKLWSSSDIWGWLWYSIGKSPPVNQVGRPYSLFKNDVLVSYIFESWLFMRTIGLILSAPTYHCVLYFHMINALSWLADRCLRHHKNINSWKLLQNVITLLLLWNASEHSQLLQV
jgi:hypothetical protein